MSSYASETRRRPVRLLLATLLFAVVAFVALAVVRAGDPPQIEIDPALPGIGRRTPVVVRVAAPGRGLSNVKAELVQGERRELLAERDFAPRPFWAFWGPRTEQEEITFEVGRDTLPELAPGEATLVVTAGRAPTWLRRPAPAVAEQLLPVRFTAPTLAVLAEQIYVAQGGSSAVRYQVGPTAVRDGVAVGDWWFPGFPLPGGGEDEHFAFFAAPHDMSDASAIRLVAADELGNEASAAFVDLYLPKPLRTDTINLNDAFLQRVVPAIREQTPGLEDQGDLLANYLVINRDLRQTNAAALVELAAKSRPEFLWDRVFLQLPNTQSMASFADRRTYLYDGREVDRQDHLGFDLASTKKAPVLAANDGVVLMTEYFGIYGNTVVVDHGFGLMSLYAHLSSFAVAPGDAVTRGQELGRTGETGLAGGDHLHFSMLVHGRQVNPLEWWDAGWIRDRVTSKLGSALKLEP